MLYPLTSEKFLLGWTMAKNNIVQRDTSRVDMLIFQSWPSARSTGKGAQMRSLTHSQVECKTVPETTYVKSNVCETYNDNIF